MPREVYQDEHLEVPCPSCKGVGFFGNGPYVEFCAYCQGTGILIEEVIPEVAPERKPIGREYGAERERAVGDDDVPF